jgi:L-fuconolactonase
MTFSPLDRRRFLLSTAAGALAVAAPGSQARAESPALPESPVAANPIPIVDTHQHLWDLDKFNLPWCKDNATLNRSFVTSHYLQATQGLNVVKTVYMEVDVTPTQQVQEAEYVLDLCRTRGNPMVGAVISGRPGSEAFAEYIGKFKGSEFIKGVRQVLHGDGDPKGFCLGAQFVKSVQLLGELGMSFDLCMRDQELLDGDKLVALCPNTRFIVDHCGNLSVQETDAKKRQKWQDGMKALAQRPNVVCKISGIIATAKQDWKVADLQPNIQFSMETFGPDRRMFAGDWPVCTLTASFAQWVNALKEIVKNMGMSAADQKKLFHDNAVKFYNLKDKA